MKRRQMTALILSVIMTVSSCMPMNGISVFAAESAGAGSTEAAAVVEPVSEEQTEEQTKEQTEEPVEETTDTDPVLTEDDGAETDPVEDAESDSDQSIEPETPDDIEQTNPAAKPEEESAVSDEVSEDDGVSETTQDEVEVSPTESEVSSEEQDDAVTETVLEEKPDTLTEDVPEEDPSVSEGETTVSRKASTGVVSSGTCGENLTWALDDGGTMTISGQGEMDNYEWSGPDTSTAPWPKTIQKVTIEDGVTSIGEYAFYGCSGLTSITIPNSVTSIEWSAFSGCSSLESITIPDGVTSIGSGAFSRSGLTSITIPASVTSIGNYAFSGCSSLTSITILEGVTRIGSYAFSGCSSLTSITIPASVTSIGESTFSGCSGLTSVTIPASVTSIGDWAFSDCSSLTSIAIPASVTRIEDWAFCNCTGLRSITIPDSVTSIVEGTFSGCSSLISITIPNGVTYIGPAAFDGCSSLSDVYYSGDEESWSNISIDSICNDSLLNANITYFDTAIDIKNGSITGLSDKTYTGEAITQNPVVTYGGKTLTEGTDYTVKYSNNINAGTASAVITGKGNYTGSVTKQFTITKAAQSMTASLSAAKISTGGVSNVKVNDLKESAKLTYSSSNTAVATVSAAGVVTAKGAGTATITVTAAATANYNSASAQTTVSVLPGATTKFTAVAATNGKGIKLTWNKVAGATQYQIYRNNKLLKTVGNVATYTDSKANTNGSKYTFKIVAKASTGASTKSKSVVYYKVNRPAVKKLTNSASKKMTVKWAKNAKSTGYQIQYGLKKNFKGAKTTKINKKTTVSKTISNLKKGKTYYVRIRTYKKVGKVTFYSAWSTAKKVKIKK